MPSTSKVIISGLLVGFGIGLLTDPRTRGWVILAACVWLCWFLLRRRKRFSQAASAATPSVAPTIGEHAFRPASATVARAQPEPATVPITVAAGTTETRFRIPKPAAVGAVVWISANQLQTIAGISVSGGMIYVGAHLTRSYHHPDPALIDPSLPVAASGDYTQRQTDYYPSYGELTPSARRAYLNWLADGRCHPAADISFVFLFFYGLERRVLLDMPNSPDARQELPILTGEIERLLDIYGSSSNSFRNYASQLLDWIVGYTRTPQLYTQPLPDFGRPFELPFRLRFCLGQVAVDGVPLPPELALAWVRADPEMKVRTPAQRCPQEFAALFLPAYSRTFGEGIVLRERKQPLHLLYRAASKAIGQLTLNCDGIPDVAMPVGSRQKLSRLVEEATEALDAFSRFIGKNAEHRNGVEAWLLLPEVLWPQAAHQVMKELQHRLAENIQVMTLEALLALFGARAPLGKDRLLILARALDSRQIGSEPDLLGDGRLPKPEDPLALFAVAPGEVISRATPAYHLAALTLDLAAAVAKVDGDFNDAELAHLGEQVRNWAQLGTNQRRRLLAHLELLAEAPVSWSDLKGRMGQLSEADRAALANFMTEVAQADGNTTPAEIRLLQRIYGVLGLDSSTVFTHLHRVAVGSDADGAPRFAPGPTGIAGVMKLDPERIAALQADTQRVAGLLATIFTADADLPSGPAPLPREDDATAHPENFAGLDGAHLALVHILLGRANWSRAELAAATTDLDLMLDGALEAINEATFDRHDLPLIEGDDPLSVNQELAEILRS